FAAAPHTFRLIERKIRPFEQFMARVGELRNAAGNLGAGPQPAQETPAPAPPPAPAAQENGPAMLLDGARSVVLSGVTIVILTLFLLSGGPPMLAIMTSAFAND